MEFLLDQCESLGVKRGVSLSKFSWLDTGGKADFFFKPNSLVSLIKLMKKIPINTDLYVLGNGSNILIRDGGIKSLVIKLGPGFADIVDHEEYLEVGAAVLNSTLSYFCLSQSIIGFAFISVIPGSIGGGIFMNSGCYGKEFADILFDVTVVDRSGKVYIIPKKEINFSYRCSNLSKDFIIIKAKFIKQKGTQDEIKNQMLRFHHDKKKSQPIIRKTAGSTFMNHGEMKAWQLIRELKCDQITFGDAMWSKKHANFLVNMGNATSKDLELLIKTTRNKIYNDKGIYLRLELKILGSDI